MKESAYRYLGEQIEKAWLDLNQEAQVFYLMVRGETYVLTHRPYPGARPVKGSFTKFVRKDDGTWQAFPFTKFREAVEAVMTELRPG